MSDEKKGNFKSDVSQSLIDAALESVRKRQEGVEVPVEGAGPENAPPPGSEASAAPASATEEEVASLKAQLELSMAQGRQMMDRLKDEHEKVLRASADLENYKKRAAKEKEEMQKFGNERLLKDMLPVVDNFDRALEHAKGQADFDSFKKGVEMIRKLFDDTLGKHGVKSFSAKGKPFDPNQHEAMSQVETNEMPPNHVFNEVLRGFTLNDRLVRPALVVVSKEPPAAPAAPPNTAAAPNTSDASPSTAAEPPDGEKQP